MSFLIDTDICSAYLKGNRNVWQKFHQHGGQLQVSVITVGELYTWVLRKSVGNKRREPLEEFLSGMVLLEISPRISLKFGELRANLLDQGCATPDLDLFIAATALMHDLTVVTHNLNDYAFVTGLRCQDWLSS